MFSSPWGRLQRPRASRGLPPNDNRSDDDANRERVLLLERDERLEVAERQRQSFLNKLQLEARARRSHRHRHRALTFSKQIISGPNDFHPITVVLIKTNTREVGGDGPPE